LAQEFKINKVDEDQRCIFGWASVALKADGTQVVDSQDDIISPQTLEKAAYDYVLRSRDGGLEHERKGVATMIESFVCTPEKLEALGLAKDALPTGWFVGMKVHDADVWKRVKSGELNMFSIGGRSKRRDVK
jgi:hypothetical protein